ncbi:MAG TPA: APC family permease [Acidimicrobiales bacterium]|nr:APC family permease [Acidimicrobiales bacterium]
MTDAHHAGLRRALGLRTVVSTSTGLAFAALEYLAAAGLVAYVAGDAAWIAIGTAGLLALLAWGFFGELNGMFPTAAAIRLYMKRSMDDRAALTITFTYMTTIVLVIAADAFIVGSAIAHVFGQASWTAGIWILGLLAVAVASNLRGIKVAGSVQDVATYTILLATAVVGVVALVRSHAGLRFPFTPLHGHHPADFVEAVALGVFLYSAFEWVTTNAEEVRKPEHVHRGMLLAVGLLFTVCSVATVAMSHVLDHRQLVSAFPQLYLGQAALGRAGLWLMAAITAVTALNTFNGGFITASRFIYATAREGSLPRQLASLNARAVPWVPVVGLGALSLVVALVVAATHSWQVLVATGAGLEAMIYAVAAYCVLRLRGRLPDHPRPFRMWQARVLGAAGLVLFGILAVVASVSVNNHFDLRPLVVMAVCAVAALAYVLRWLPKVQAAEAARRSATPRRRPSRASPATGAAPGADAPAGPGAAAEGPRPALGETAGTQ